MSLMPSSWQWELFEENAEREEAAIVLDFDCVNNNEMAVGKGWFLRGLPLWQHFSKISFSPLGSTPNLFDQRFGFNSPLAVSNRNQFLGDEGLLDSDGRFYALSGYGTGINDHNQATASDSYPASLIQKFIPPTGDPWWEEFDLNAMLPENSGWVIQYVSDVNNGGVILGWARYTDPDDPTVFFDKTVMLVPVGIEAYRNRREMPVKDLEISTWEGAFKTVYDRRTGLHYPHELYPNFIDRVPERFRIKVPNLGTTAKLRFSTFRPDPAGLEVSIDPPTELPLMADPANARFKRTTWQILVADGYDDQFDGSGAGTDEEPGDRTHVTFIDKGRARIEIEVNGLSGAMDVPTPDPEKVHHLYVDPVILRNLPAAQGGVPAVTPAQVMADETTTSRLYAQLNILVFFGTPLIADPPDGVDLEHGLIWSSVPHRDPYEIIGAYGTDSLNDLHLFYVPGFTDGGAGKSMRRANLGISLERYRYNVFVDYSSGWNTSAHELAHVVGECGHEDPNLENVMLPVNDNIETPDVVNAHKRFNEQQKRQINLDPHVQ